MASIKLPLAVAYAIATVLAVAALAVGTHAIASVEDAPIDLSKTYSNSAYGFTLQMPADFSAYPADGAPARDETGAPEGKRSFCKIARETRCRSSSRETIAL